MGFGTLQSGPPILPDTPTISVGKMYDGTPPRFDMRGYDAGNVPQVLDPVRAEMRALTEVILQHPVRAIHGEAAPTLSSFRVDEPVAFELRLKNVGIQPLKLDNPFHKRMEQQLTVRFLVTKDAPVLPNRGPEQLWVDAKVERVHSDNKQTELSAPGALAMDPGMFEVVEASQ
ncbi:MAG: hypothetical protein JXB05_39060 [Myxococcaceae bacterium]|nr:hypothetical protein [Myxococcaceae bacterium]